MERDDNIKGGADADGRGWFASVLSPAGRLRPEYYVMAVPALVLTSGWLLRIAVAVWSGSDPVLAQNAVARVLLAACTVILAAGLIWILLAATSRRFHDANAPGFLALAWLVPVPLLWLVMYLALSLLPSVRGRNRYGRPPPKPPVPLGILLLVPLATLAASIFIDPVLWVYLLPVLAGQEPWILLEYLLFAP